MRKNALRPAIETSGFEVRSVIGISRFPRPPASITALYFIYNSPRKDRLSYHFRGKRKIFANRSIKKRRNFKKSIEKVKTMCYNTEARKPNMPVCRNGRRDRLKICCQQWRVGSSPTTGTKKKRQFSTEDCRFFLFSSLFSFRSSLFSKRKLSFPEKR